MYPRSEVRALGARWRTRTTYVSREDRGAVKEKGNWDVPTSSRDTHTSLRWFPPLLTPLLLAPTNSPLHHCQSRSLPCVCVCPLMHVCMYVCVFLHIQVYVDPRHHNTPTQTSLMQTPTFISITVFLRSTCQERNK